MAKKKTSTKPASPRAAKKTNTAKQPAAKKSTTGDGGLFQPNSGDENTMAEKSLANAVLAAGGTDKLLSILRHVEAAGGTAKAVEALAVYERMRRVLHPTGGDEAVAHPLFDSMDQSAGSKSGADND